MAKSEEMLAELMIELENIRIDLDKTIKKTTSKNLKMILKKTLEQITLVEKLLGIVKLK